jgi:hypothetical protein
LDATGDGQVCPNRIVEIDRFAKLVGRQYHLFDFGLTLGVGGPDRGGV